MQNERWIAIGRCSNGLSIRIQSGPRKNSLIIWGVTPRCNSMQPNCRARSARFGTFCAATVGLPSLLAVGMSRWNVQPPMQARQIDFKDASTVPADLQGKQGLPFFPLKMKKTGDLFSWFSVIFRATGGNF
jgi:hypothetical protein